MRRREFISYLGTAAAAWPLGVRAEQAMPMRLMGGLAPYRESDVPGRTYHAALMQRLGALGWREGTNLQVKWRYAGGDPVLFKRYAAELVALGPDVILAVTSPAVQELRKLTNTVPIVFVVVNDPVDQGFVASLAHPGGNLTGFGFYDPPTVVKLLAMLTQITPPVAHAAVLYDPSTAPWAASMMRAIADAAPSLGVAVRDAPCSDDTGIEATMSQLAAEQHGGVLVLPDTFGVVHREAMVAAAAKYRVPAAYVDRRSATRGELMTYGVNVVELFPGAADYVDRILKGEKPANLAVQYPTKFTLTINLKTAAALGITVAAPLLDTADEVIE